MFPSSQLYDDRVIDGSSVQHLSVHLQSSPHGQACVHLLFHLQEHLLYRVRAVTTSVVGVSGKREDGVEIDSRWTGPTDEDTEVPGVLLGLLTWRKSAASNPNGDCVELAPLPAGGVAVRNSRAPSGTALIYTRAEIEAFLHGAKAGEFDDLVM